MRIMTEPSSSPATFSRADTGIGTKRLSPSLGKTWFGTREGRRYGWELGFVIVAKLVLLIVLWLVFIEPWPRPIAPPAVVVQQLYLPALPAAPTP